MPYLAIVTALALIEYMGISILVGRARGKYGIKAPATSGHPVFERTFRVHQNTLEQLLIFLPSLWLFGTYVSAGWGALIGLVFIVGRAIYFRGLRRRRGEARSRLRDRLPREHRALARRADRRAARDVGR